MGLIFLTRILLIVYAIVCLAMLIRVVALFTAGENRRLRNIGDILLFPLLMLTKSGRDRLVAILSPGEIV